MSKENEEDKRSPLIPRPVGKPLPIIGEIEVPYEIYEQYCSQCMRLEKTLTPREEYVKQLRNSWMSGNQ